MLSDRLNTIVFNAEAQVLLRLRSLKARHKIISRVFRAFSQIRNRKQLDSLHAQGLETIIDISDALKAKGIVCFPVFGTLLGIAREGKIISYDNDIDIAVVASDAYNWNDIDSAVQTLSAQRIRQFSFEGNVTECAYSLRGYNFDIFMFYPNGTGEMHRAYIYFIRSGVYYPSPKCRSVAYMDIPVSKSTVELKSEKGDITVPSNYEELLQQVYGPNWRTPDPDWVSGTGWTTIDGSFGIKNVD